MSGFLNGIKRAVQSKESRALAIIVAVFLAAYYAPLEDPRLSRAILEAFHMLQEYAREHVLFCLIPAFFIAGAIANFISQGAVIKYFGSEAPRWLAYSIASISGTILSVCSCTVLPLFSGIYRRGAGIGPACAFLYSGPAINVLAVILTARVLGWQLGLARALAAVVFAVVIGLVMSALFSGEEGEPTQTVPAVGGAEDDVRSPIQNAIFFVTLVMILIFAAWTSAESGPGLWNAIFSIKWYVVGALLLVLAYIQIRWFDGEERVSWVAATWDFAKQILPLLFAGVLVAGFLMGRPGAEAGLIPAHYVAAWVGGNSLAANLAASVIGAFMYFATLTEIPILQGLMGLGMGPGPSLALLLAGPALSLPNMLVIRSVIGTRKTLVFVLLVVVLATTSGMIYGGIMS
ncbi:MAG: permease [Bacillota bacterium]